MMRGHQPLIAMRRNGNRPVSVTISTDGGDAMKSWRIWPWQWPGQACIQIDLNETVSLLDLRCVVGLPVSVVGCDLARVDEVAAACRKHDAGRVIAVHLKAGPEYRVTSINDTAGIATWPA